MKSFYSPTGSLMAPIMSWRFRDGLSLLALSLFFGMSSFAAPQEVKTFDPMEDKYSQAVRSEFAKCREEKTPMSKYLCTCRVLETQCAAPRRLEHGDWNTVEFWPSDDPAAREVQFILLMDYDILGDLGPSNQGIVLTCMAGMSDLSVFVGENADPDIKPQVFIDQISIQSSFENVEAHIISFSEPSKVFQALGAGQLMSISYTDLDEIERYLEFDTFGFDEVSKGWEKLCNNTSS